MNDLLRSTPPPPPPPRIRNLLALLTLLVFLLSPLATRAADITVGAGCSLDQAIQSANNDSAVGSCTAGNGADTITFSSNITLSDNQTPINSDITINGGGNTISGNNARRIFTINGGNVTLNNMVVSNGRLTLSRGAAIFIGGGTVTLSSVTIQNTHTNRAGALAIDGGTVTLSGSTVTNNTSSGGSQYGAGIHLSGSGALTITGSVISNNSRTGTQPSGGGIYTLSSGALTIRNSLISGNEGSLGAALFIGQNQTGAVTVENTIIRDNRAVGSGRPYGGIYISGGRTAAVTFTFRHITMSNNFGPSVGNGVQFRKAAAGSASIIIANSVFDDAKTGASDCAVTGGGLTSTNNLVEDGSCSAAVSGDPLLVTPAGATHLVLSDTSPALGRGAATHCAAVSTDYLGNMRPATGCDLGAVENTMFPVPDTDTPEPDTDTPVPDTDTPVPPDTDTPVPPPDTDTPVPPDTDTPVPPPDTDTPVPPDTDTPVPPPDTDTPVPPDTDTPVPPPDTDTPVPPDTDTPVPPPDTDTPVPPDTDTPVPPDTDTPVPPPDTDTPVPPDTDTPVPVDTDTPVPVDTDTPVPVDTDTPVPVDTDTPVPVDTDTPEPADTAAPLVESKPKPKKKQRTATPTITPQPATCDNMDGSVQVSYDSGLPQCNAPGYQGGEDIVANEEIAAAGGYLDAVDVWGWLGAGVEVCFDGAGGLVFLDASTSPRTLYRLASYMNANGQTCAFIDRPGTVVLMAEANIPPMWPPAPWASAPSGSSSSSSAQRMLSGCMVRTEHTLYFRGSPGGDVIPPLVVEENALLTALERTADWFKVDYHGAQGWISAAHVTPQGNCG